MACSAGGGSWDAASIAVTLLSNAPCASATERSCSCMYLHQTNLCQTSDTTTVTRSQQHQKSYAWLLDTRILSTVWVGGCLSYLSVTSRSRVSGAAVPGMVLFPGNNRYSHSATAAGPLKTASTRSMTLLHLAHQSSPCERPSRQSLHKHKTGEQSAGRTSAQTAPLQSPPTSAWLHHQVLQAAASSTPPMLSSERTAAPCPVQPAVANEPPSILENCTLPCSKECSKFVEYSSVVAHRQ